MAETPQQYIQRMLRNAGDREPQKVLAATPRTFRAREGTVAHIARMFAGHDINHLGQIERILSD